jgi:hypothetical protein
VFYQNVFVSEFRGDWVLGDRQYSPTFRCLGNAGRGPEIVRAWNQAPYDLSGNDVDGNATRNLTINFARDLDLFKNWVSITVDLGVSATTTAADIVTTLTANTNFAAFFTASKDNDNRVLITQRLPQEKFRFYISNGTAESVLGFNSRAGIADLPTYFSRHTIANARLRTDSQNILQQLTFEITAITSANPAQVTSVGHGLTTGDTITIVDSDSGVTIDGNRVATVVDANNFTVPVNNSGAVGNYGVWARRVDAALITNAVDKSGNSLGLALTDVKADYELLGGRSGIFTFTNNTIDGSNRITESIEYAAGAIAGDLGKRIRYTYTGANTNPDQVTEEPYTLAAGDLVTP